jgi:EAL domain-containing protein (putative c-di-GMP-specific phosphodiesterase class I)/GGDEF domain-containing protein
MTDRIGPPSPLMSEAQFMEALDSELLKPELRKGVSAVLRVRVNAHMAAVSLVGEDHAKSMLLLPSCDRIRECVRAGDFVASAKPGVFLVLLRNMHSEDDLESICERMIRAGKRPFHLASAQVHSGFSVGAAIIAEQTDAVSLVDSATEVMYRRDRNGDGGFDLFPDEFAERYSDPAEIEAYISEALVKDLFELDFQPQYRRDGTLIGAGALIRMQSRDGKRLKGEAFLPRVEEAKLVVQMGERILRQLFLQAGDWLRRDIPIPSLSIAVAAPHFLQNDFSQSVGALLQEAGVPGSLLELELTESTIMTDFEAASRVLTELAALGVRFAVCGVSLGPFLSSSIPRLPIGTLQVSCSPDSLPSIGSLPLLRAVISQGHRLGLRVTAKDVQLAQQRTELCAAGCDGFQGSLLSEPLSREKMEAVFAS